MKRIFVLLLALFCGAFAWAQDDGVPKVEIPVGFSMINVHPNLSPITSFNVFGGGGQVDFNLGNVWGIKADFMGYTQGSGLRNQLEKLGYAGKVNGNLFTYMFGPQIKKHSGKVQPFAEFLFGAAHTNAYASILTAEGKIAQSSGNNNGFAMALGGGIDLQVARHLALRPVEVDYLLTRFSANHVAGYTANQNNFRYVGGLNFMFGGAPPIPPTASCSVSPTEIWSGAPVTATVTTQNFNPKHTLTYKWSSTGGQVSGKSTTGNVDTTGLAPGSYTVTATATDEKEKKNNVANCNASFTAKQPLPPTASCSASPETVKAGDPSTVSVSASSQDDSTLTYTYSATSGNISGSGTSATLETTNASPGSTITATTTVTDGRGLSTTCTATVNVLSLPVTVSEVSEVGECKFMNPAKPWRVDNECKAILDDVALRIQREPNGKFVVLGYTDEQETITEAQLGAQRAVNVKYYLVSGEGKSQIDATRIDVRTSGTVKEKGTKIYFVPAGATFTQESVAIDETHVKAQSRNAPAPRKKAKRAAHSQPPPSQ